MKLWDYVDVGGDVYKDGRCCTLDSITDCRHVCDKIDAPFYVLNMSEDFRERVIEDFVSEYRSGRTPNPCVRCNALVRWQPFLQKAHELGCDYIATGHYASVVQMPNGRFSIKKGVDDTRDQSYVLWGLSQDALAKTLMPLGGLRKTEVREIANRFELRTANKKESREICFVADDDYRRFVREWDEKRGQQQKPGEIVLEDGTTVGQHNGTAFYTIGQRRGLGITHPKPLYVQQIDVESNRIIVSENDALFRTELEASNVNWLGAESNDTPFEAGVKIRYLHAPADATIESMTPDRVRISFREKQRAITPGQSVVFYDSDFVLGGGVIS
jgi:tRNA-specific 2-thiouridylase